MAVSKQHHDTASMMHCTCRGRCLQVKSTCTQHPSPWVQQSVCHVTAWSEKTSISSCPTAFLLCAAGTLSTMSTSSRCTAAMSTSACAYRALQCAYARSKSGPRARSHAACNVSDLAAIAAAGGGASTMNVSTSLVDLSKLLACLRLSYIMRLSRSEAWNLRGASSPCRLCVLSCNEDAAACARACSSALPVPYTHECDVIADPASFANTNTHAHISMQSIRCEKGANRLQCTCKVQCIRDSQDGMPLCCQCGC